MSLERHQRAVRASQNKSQSRDLEKVRRDKEWDHTKGAGSRKAGGEERVKRTNSGFSLTISVMMIAPRKQHTHTLLLVKGCFRLSYRFSFSLFQSLERTQTLCFSFSPPTLSISHLETKTTLHGYFLEMHRQQIQTSINFSPMQNFHNEIIKLYNFPQIAPNYRILIHLNNL